MTISAELYALQEIDVALDGAIARLAEIEGQLGESEALVTARGEVLGRRDRVAGLRSHQKELELVLGGVRAKAAEVEKKLYGGSLQNPKELADFQADLNSLQRQIAKQEDVLLAVLVEIEDADASLKEADSDLSRIEADWRQRKQELGREKGEIEPEVERLREARAKQSAGVGRAGLGIYGLLRERRGGQAVATVERGMCQGCRITLPMSVVQKARAGLDVVQCVSCERILLVR
ncbi:MAG: C4-type zinc ribbon domain-containing protein [Dehalococcoidia bacterium]